MKSLPITSGIDFSGRALTCHFDSVIRSTGTFLFNKITIISRSPPSFHLKYPKLANLA